MVCRVESRSKGDKLNAYGLRRYRVGRLVERSADRSGMPDIRASMIKAKPGGETPGGTVKMIEDGSILLLGGEAAKETV